jgi:hypothetical protein
LTGAVAPVRAKVTAVTLASAFALVGMLEISKGEPPGSGTKGAGSTILA